MRVDVWATRDHYASHLWPIWNALPSDVRGRWFTAQDDPRGEESGDTIVVAAYRDLRHVRHRYARLVLVEHGIGQSYLGSDGVPHPAYSGGERETYDLLLAPGLHVIDPAARHTAYVGCPKLDVLHALAPLPFDDVVAVTFHWEASRVAPEAGTALWEYLPALAQLAAEGRQLIGHAHPLLWDDAREQYERLGIESERSFDRVARRASILVADNTSALYEFASLRRPVVVLNSHRYRRDVEHGKRFWEWADVGPQVDDPGQLPAVLDEVIAAEGVWPRRLEVVQEVYAHQDGACARRAAEAILEAI